MPEVRIRRVREEDASHLQRIRRRAFAPVFASFRQLLGDEIYELAQRRHDDAQEDLLTSLIAEQDGWELYVAETDDEIAGFVSVHLDGETKVGEIGLNAVDPTCGGRGIGTAMYEFALDRMRAAGMKVATVATGADASHAPARRAYRKAGFDAEVPSVWLCRKL